jgi:hypothetical protein
LISCEEAIHGINTDGFVDVPTVGKPWHVYRMYHVAITHSAYADSCEKAGGRWRRYDILDSNEHLCKSPGVICVSRKNNRKPGNGWRSCNGVFHSGSRLDHLYCPPKDDKN